MDIVAQVFRRDHETHNILVQQQPFFEELKGFFTHGTVGLAKDGSPIWQIKVCGLLCRLVVCMCPSMGELDFSNMMQPVIKF